MAAGERGGPAINIYGPNEFLALTLTLFTEREASAGHGAAQPSPRVLHAEPGLGSTGGGLRGVMEQGMGVLWGHSVPQAPGEAERDSIWIWRLLELSTLLASAWLQFGFIPAVVPPLPKSPLRAPRPASPLVATPGWRHRRKDWGRDTFLVPHGTLQCPGRGWH